MPDLVRVSVTQEDIDQGVRKICRKCPVALAVRRLFPEAAYIEVEDEVCRVFAGTDHVRYVLPYSACDFIRRFDLGRQVEPFTFDMRRVNSGRY